MPVLIVDDDTVSLKLLKAVLEKGNYDVVPKASGKEALIYLQKGGSPALVISDVMMPRVDGFQLLRMVRSDWRLRRVPFILCTTLNDSTAVMQGHDLGATDYIVKPIKPDVVLAKVAKALRSVPGPILVVDDETVARDLLARIVEREGFEVLTAVSAAEALELLRNHNVSLVFTDVKMPNMTGLELLATIKKKHPDTPVVLMTGYGGEYRKEDVLAAGADGYITKPFHNVTIAARIEQFIK